MSPTISLKRHALPHLFCFGILVGTGALTTACSNGSLSDTHYAPQYSTAALDSFSATSTDSGAICPPQPNILPNVETQFDGTDRFTICMKKDTPTDLVIHGMTFKSNTICIFPAQYYDESHLYAKPDLTTGAPLSQCVEVSTALGAFASFSKLINFNAAFIVEKPDEAQMKTCLLGGNFSACPQNFSYGRFR